jgi:hypothetical protein
MPANTQRSTTGPEPEPGWEIDQDDAGNPLVRHSHRTLSVGAHLIRDPDGSRRARCPSCGDEFDLPARPDASSH